MNSDYYTKQPTYESLRSLCATHNCPDLAQPLHDANVTQARAREIMTDVDAIHATAAAVFPHDTARRLASQFAHAAYAGPVPKLADVTGRIMVELRAAMGGRKSSRRATAMHSNDVLGARQFYSKGNHHDR